MQAQLNYVSIANQVFVGITNILVVAALKQIMEFIRQPHRTRSITGHTLLGVYAVAMPVQAKRVGFHVPRVHTRAGC